MSIVEARTVIAEPKLVMENRMLKQENERLERLIETLRTDKKALAEALRKLVICMESECYECSVDCEPGEGPVTIAKSALEQHGNTTK
jgi:hypothetical protein